MNGVHDMGGMHGMGAIKEEKDEPVFHATWEGRAYGVTRAMGGWRLWNLDATRFQRELIAPVDYFRMSYYERWIAGLVELMLKNNLVTRAEIESGKSDSGAPVRTPTFTADKVAAFVSKGMPARRDVTVAASFRANQRVRARNMNPMGHTRLPRYVRGKVGTVDRDHGIFVFPDTNAHFNGEKPQHVYSVRFVARDVWGAEASPRDSIYVDMWDDYLEPA
ncbi:MAG TPA: nitrile hydratase subunit beta [Steroidobacteraceae bacterium]|jgi:nitrile hydratase|nr:nitrile hydratase subunit beta [Steroidobacteraceae bacterium]